MSGDKVNEELVLDDPAPDVEVAEEPDEELPEEKEPDPADEPGDDEPEPEEEEPEAEEEKPKPKAKMPETPPEEKVVEAKAPIVEDSEEAVAGAYEKAMMTPRAYISLLNRFIDGEAEVKGQDGSQWEPYAEMTPSRRRGVDKLLTRYESQLESLGAEKDRKIESVRASKNSSQIEQGVADAIKGVGEINAAFKDIDEATRERLEARYFRLLRSGKLPSMTDDQIVREMTNGITPVKAGKNGAAKPARRNTNTVRKSENSFRARVEKSDEAAGPKVTKSDRAAVEERFRKVMGYDPSPGSEIEDLILAIKRNKK